MQRLGQENVTGPGLKGSGSAAPLLHRAEACLNALSEPLAGTALHSFHLFLNAAIGPDSKTDGALGHPGCEIRLANASGVGRGLGRAPHG
jgi:hypothetical protein